MTAEEVLQLKAEILDLRVALVAHNDRLRSAVAIADRDGRDTNWEAFRTQARTTLERNHSVVTKAREALG